MDALRRKDMGADLRHQRHQRGRRRAHPVGQRRDVEIDAFPGIDCALTVERQMQAVLGEQNVGEKFWARAAARDRVRWGGRLADRFAGSAGELLAHCQSALDRDPVSASKRDPLVLRFERLAFAPSELAGVAETGRARVDV